jgi:hypothetical protein
MNPSNSGQINESNTSDNETNSFRESWDCPQLIPLDLGSAQAKFCMFGSEASPDNGPLTIGCS